MVLNDIKHLYKTLVNEHKINASRAIKILIDSPWSLMPLQTQEECLEGFGVRKVYRTEVGIFEIIYETKLEAIIVLMVGFKYYWLEDSSANIIPKTSSAIK